MSFVMRRVAATALAAFAGAGMALPVSAGAGDYEFQLAQDETALGAGIVMDVRLIDKRTGELVPDAVIFAWRIDMAPEGMETMTAPVELLPSAEVGVYRLETELIMEGSWRLSLAAKIQGESETLENSLIFRAVP